MDVRKKEVDESDRGLGIVMCWICGRQIESSYPLKTRVYDPVLGAFAKLRKATISFVMSVRLPVRRHGTTRLPLDGFS